VYNSQFVRKPSLSGWLLLLFLLSVHIFAYGQVGGPADSLKADSLRAKKSKLENRSYNLSKQYDFEDLTRNLLHPKRKADSAHRGSGITIVPNIAANPTIGAQLGIKAVAGRRLGNDPNTLLSIAATSASITSKGIIYFYVNHNIFTPGNKWNFQGNLVVSKTVTPDYGFGIGKGLNEGSTAESILADPNHKVYSIHSYYFNFREKVYKE
jgi:hypothetical protein